MQRAPACPLPANRSGLTPLGTLLINLGKRMWPIHGIYMANDKREKPL
jgi:hypothetical protein